MNIYSIGLVKNRRINRVKIQNLNKKSATKKW